MKKNQKVEKYSGGWSAECGIKSELSFGWWVVHMVVVPNSSEVLVIYERDVP